MLITFYMFVGELASTLAKPGAKIIDISKIYNYEMDYDFEDKLSIGQLIVGANLRHYNLDTQGTLYTDYNNKPIEYQEYGAYAQLKRNIFDDKVTLSGSLRYDKQTVLEEGNITPRLGLLFNLSENQKNQEEKRRLKEKR